MCLKYTSSMSNVQLNLELPSIKLINAFKAMHKKNNVKAYFTAY